MILPINYIYIHIYIYTVYIYIYVHICTIMYIYCCFPCCLSPSIFSWWQEPHLGSVALVGQQVVGRAPQLAQVCPSLTQWNVNIQPTYRFFYTVYTLYKFEIDVKYPQLFFFVCVLLLLDDLEFPLVSEWNKWPCSLHFQDNGRYVLTLLSVG